MTTRLISLMLSGSLLSAMSCSSTRPHDDSAAPHPVPIDAATAVRPARNSTQNALPKAVIYKTNRDVDDHVTVVLTPDHQNLVSFPAPSDVGKSSAPLHLTGGWLLDRRGGIGPDTAFLTLTYSEYAALAETPSTGTILSKIMPGVTVTEAYRLDMTLNRAIADTSAVNRIILQGLPGAIPLVDPMSRQAMPDPLE